MHKEFKKIISIADKDLANWFAKNQREFGSTIYSSVDIRDNGQKIAPVDTNLFPAGFNNLNDKEIIDASTEISNFLSNHFSEIKSIGLLVESHTRNLNYFKNLFALKKIFEKTGIDFQLISLSHSEKLIVNETEIQIAIFPAKTESGYIRTEDFVFDVLVSNNDFSDGIPAELRQVKQPIIPTVCSGWFNRKKSNYLEIYDLTIKEFSRYFGLDPFYYQAAYKNCGKIDFKKKLGLDCVANSVDKMIYTLNKEYLEHGIKQTPYVFIKAERGTYGMGITTVKDGEEVYSMNKKIRNKMDVIKGGAKNTEVIIQEGISSHLKYKDYPAEVMIYTVNSKIISRILRFNTQKDSLSSLNSSGLQFMNFQDSLVKLQKKNMIKIYDIIAKVAVLAAARELESLY
ncbi:MAG: glutamate--cysteine ligase [Rickettsiales bacterium]